MSEARNTFDVDNKEVFKQIEKELDGEVLK